MKGIDPITGCAHIRNGIRKCRVCSACEAAVPDHLSDGTYINENQVAFCWQCGEMFDHTDDEGTEDE